MKPRNLTNRIRMLAAAVAMTAVAAPSVFAASQTWTNAPADSTFTNTVNWVGLAVPGALNQTGNSVNNDTVTFNSALAGGIGGAGNPILVDSATATNGARARTVGSITFDTPDVGAYVFQGQDAFNFSDLNIPFAGMLFVSHNGTIRMNAGVTNSQRFELPLFTRLPSSTAGIYNLVNDSTNDVTMFIQTMTNSSATSRGTDFRLGGSNTGTNTVGSLSAGSTTSGGNGFLKQGAGTWILPNQNDFRAQTAVRIAAGTLIARNDGVFNGANSANVTVSGGVLQLDGINLFQTFIRQQSNSVIRMNGSGALQGVTVLTDTGANPTLATTSASDVFTVGTAFVPADSIVKGGAADTVLHTTGPGTVYLPTANTYVGKWSIDGGTNQIAELNALGTGANVNVGAGAVFDFTPLGAVTFIPTTAGFGGSGTATAASVMGDALATLDLSSKAINLTFTPASASGDLTRPALTIAQGTLAIGGNTFFVNNAFGTPLGAGTYRLINQTSGSITSGGGYAVVVGGSGLSAGTVASISVSGGNVDLVVVVYVPKNLVWRGVGADWDIATSSTWLDGASPSVFNNSDVVTFNGTGIVESNVNLTTTLAPASATVDTSSGNYNFAGTGQIGGTASLTKNSAGVLSLGTANSYAGGTVVNDGTLRVAVANAISATGSGNVSVAGSGTVDLNGFNNAINGLNGSGTVDVQTAAASTLTLGNNDASGDFSGTATDSDPSGTLSIVKVGTGSQTLSGANSYAGTTTVSLGTLVVSNQTALGVGDLSVNGGTVDLATNLTLNSLAGSSGSIVNNSSSSTNLITVTGTTATTLTANVSDGSGGGGVGITLLGGTLTMGGNSTYTGGTYVGNGATLAIPNSPAAVGGFLIASNGSTLFLSGGSGSPGTPNSVTTVDGATVKFNSGAEGKIWQAQFHGNAGTTNWFRDPMSFGQSLSFADFRGVALFANTNTGNSNLRFFNGAGVSGGDDTVFVFERGNVHTRDTQTVRLGAIRGGNNDAGIGDQAGFATYEIGGKNTTEAFHGYIRAVNTAISKVGTGGLTLDGTRYVTNPVTFDGVIFTDYVVMTNENIAYNGATTVSNGVLTIVAPNNLNLSTNIILAGTSAVLDVTASGSFSNETAVDFNAVTQPTNTIIVTNGLLAIGSGQGLRGFGTILGSVTTVAGSTVTVGASIGTLNVSGSISLDGTVNMELDRTNSQTADLLSAGSFSGTGAVIVTNIGPDLITGDTFQLFSAAVPGVTVNLPVSNVLNTIAYVWTNKVALDGSLELLSGASPVNPNPTNITFTSGGGNLTLTWPADHTGWTLQTQTNTRAVGLNTNWFNVTGSTTTNQMEFPVNATDPTVFFRMVYP